MSENFSLLTRFIHVARWFCFFHAIIFTSLHAAPVYVMPGSPAAYAYFPPVTSTGSGAASGSSTAVVSTDCKINGKINSILSVGDPCLLPSAEGGGVVKFVGTVPTGGALVTTPVDQGVFMWTDVTSNTCYPQLDGNSLLNSHFPSLVCTTNFVGDSAVGACSKLNSDNTQGNLNASLGTGWRLPTGGELMMMYHSRDRIGGFSFDATGSSMTPNQSIASDLLKTDQTWTDANNYVVTNSVNVTLLGALDVSLGRLITFDTDLSPVVKPVADETAKLRYQVETLKKLLKPSGTSIDPNSAASSYWAGAELKASTTGNIYANAASLNFFTGGWDSSSTAYGGVPKGSYRLTRCVRTL